MNMNDNIKLPVKEYLEKEIGRYVIATFDNPTNYVVVKGGCNYEFIDNIQMATKFLDVETARCVLSTCREIYKIDLVAIPMKVKYFLVDEGGD